MSLEEAALQAGLGVAQPLDGSSVKIVERNGLGQETGEIILTQHGGGVGYTVKVKILESSSGPFPNGYDADEARPAYRAAGARLTTMTKELEAFCKRLNGWGPKGAGRNLGS